MKYRKKMSRGKSRRLFTKTASRVHRRNGQTGYMMRGGIRM
jgi:hypothetical protein